MKRICFSWKRTEENEVEVKEEEEEDDDDKNEKQPNIYIITKYEKNYVYYYSSSTKLVPCRTSLLNAILVVVVLWLLNAGWMTTLVWSRVRSCKTYENVG